MHERSPPSVLHTPSRNAFSHLSHGVETPLRLVKAGKGLDLRRGRILLELEKNDLHKDDALEVMETLTGLAESYGYSEEDGFGDGGGGGDMSVEDA